MREAGESRAIEVRGACENNLRHVDVDIPKDKLVVLAGVSGSGKSSLAFDTIATESERQWQQGYPLFVRNKMPHYERPKVESIGHLTPVVVVDQRAYGANARSTVGTAIDAAPLLRLLFSRVGEPSAGGSMAYSFNHPHGMCPDCTGLGKRLTLVEDRLFNLGGTLRDGGLTFSQFAAGWQSVLYTQNPYLDPDKRLRDFTDSEWELLRYGADEPVNIVMHGNGAGMTWNNDYEGVVPRFLRLYVNRDISKLKKGLRDEIATYVEDAPCPTCGGTGLNPAALASKINGRNIADVQNMQIDELLAWLRGIESPVGASIAGQIAVTLENMVRVGVGYLTLGRRTDTLSGGEVQRLKIVRHLGSSLSDVTYVFDEPTAGLHPADAERISRLLVDLRDKGNTVLVVEHSRDIVGLADEVIELGPLAGERGGEVVFQGSVRDLMRADTFTAEALVRKARLNERPRSWSEAFDIEHACIHNLKDVSIRIPKGVLTAVCGVAGSGKSSLVRHEFARRYPDVVVIDQKPIGTSSRSTPATFTGAMDLIRRLFAEANGVEASWFSNDSKGACDVCGGRGSVKPEIAFADPVEIRCEECGGSGFNPEALSYRYRGETIEDVMELTVDEALGFFAGQGKVVGKLRQLRDVGLGYLRLGQQTSSMSGGENQRLKLARELGRKAGVYVLDEPSTGLHYRDIQGLIALFGNMVERGSTVIMIEHRMEMIAASDWIIEMGPEGGSAGGRVLYEGAPTGMLDCANSVTAPYLRRACGVGA
ncbi:excinuclease ABC subunit UvrA [Curtanaerobium respiraculi]|uniref:excinuclease ABC subunit UvrA n=1 Tax=Curtanaerobium respiraculi TaxID=2949669 RepID=UPI0024B3C111|nr:excinuclease ABC subunit UvrA [Curtanaerobium respiraculi]